ncbi:MAG: PAS domain S-box protein [Mariniphaga sp.]
MKRSKSSEHSDNSNTGKQESLHKADPAPENFFQAMFESHKAVMLLIDPATGFILDANQAALKFYKYSKEELKRLKIQDINQLNRDEVKEEWMKALREERSYFVFPHKLADGQIRQVEVYSSPFTYQGKSMLYSIIHDVTEKKYAEEALRRSEEKFEVAFRSNPNVLILSDLETGKIYEVNDTFCSLTGFEKEDVIGKSTLEINMYVSPDDRQKMVEKLKSRGKVKNFEITIQHRNGKKLWVLLSSEFLQTSLGETILTTLQDITGRKRLEEQRRKELELLKVIFDTVPAMISIYDPEIRNINLNREVERVTGWTKRDTKNKNIMELVYPDPIYRKEIAAYMQSLQPGFKDIVMTCKDGSVKDTIWANVEMKDGRRIGTGIDISERKKAQEELL